MNKQSIENFEENLRWSFAEAVVRVKGRVVIDHGKVLDLVWWEEKVKKCYERRNNFLWH